ncbi:hypothetical protein JCM17823_10910 [Halorubrum gandharaense]
MVGSAGCLATRGNGRNEPESEVRTEDGLDVTVAAPRPRIIEETNRNDVVGTEFLNRGETGRIRIALQGVVDTDERARPGNRVVLETTTVATETNESATVQFDTAAIEPFDEFLLTYAPQSFQLTVRNGGPTGDHDIRLVDPVYETVLDSSILPLERGAEATVTFDDGYRFVGNQWAVAARRE